LPYYPWLRRLALEKLFRWKRFHLRTGKRDVAREEAGAGGRNGFSAITFVNGLIDTATSPSAHVSREEERGRALAALEGLVPLDRRVLELRYFQDMSYAEIASELGIGLSAVKMRHLRALERFHARLYGTNAESGG
jgi:RNA polymerase sigma-70 factor (ECF subfamily)